MTAILTGDCREVMRDFLTANSFDAVVTDPPYELGFMGKAWDASGVAFDVETWRQAYRLLRPGGHLVAFGGTRTFHRMAVAIEDAGFEIRDQLAWVYGTGFPKSQDVSKAIDAKSQFGSARTEDIRRMSMGRDYVPSGRGRANYDNGGGSQMNGAKDGYSPATDAAREWKGWGTALKPAWEPIMLARKPFAGTVADNVLAHGTGAINVDGCRVGTDENLNGGAYSDTDRQNPFFKSLDAGAGAYVQPAGRWPANILHDGSDEVLAGFPHGGSGSASRFFYSAKATKAERGGSGHPTVKPVDLMRWLCRLVTPPGGRVLDPFAGSGSTLEAALREGFVPVGIEQSAEYVAHIERRIRGLVL